MTHPVVRLPSARGLLFGLAAALAVNLCGCALVGGAKPSGQDSHAAYALAVKSYLAGRYEKAAGIFQRLSGNSKDAQIARKAYYGLACTSLVTAKTPEDMQKALVMWNTWVQMAPECLHSEDPRLLTPLLPRLTPPTPPAVVPAPKAAPILSDEEIRREVARSRRLAAGCKEETARLRELLRKKTAEAEGLRSQLNALERLHKELSIRKKGLE